MYDNNKKNKMTRILKNTISKLHVYDWQIIIITTEETHNNTGTNRNKTIYSIN